MKTFRHFRHALALLLVSVLLAGCNALPGENLQVEELLRAPRLSGDYGAVQTALNDWLGESAQLKYPMQGELLSPFLLQDLDGDGQQDAAVLYTTAQSTNVCIAILQRDDTGAWQVRQSVEGLADTVENVRLAQLRAGDDCQLVVGYVAAQGDHYLAVYAYNDGQLSTILEQSYEQYLVEDITGGGSQDLILMSTQEDGGVQIELLTVDKEGGFRQAAVMGLSADRFSGCASVAAGLGSDRRNYLVLDGWTGISGMSDSSAPSFFSALLPESDLSSFSEDGFSSFSIGALISIIATCSCVPSSSGGTRNISGIVMKASSISSFVKRADAPFERYVSWVSKSLKSVTLMPVCADLSFFIRSLRMPQPL